MMQLGAFTEHRRFPSPTSKFGSWDGACTRIHVRLLGRFSLTIDQQIVTIPQQLLRLIAFLSRNLGQEVSRDRIASFYWGDMPTPQARRNLRVALSRLRKVITRRTNSAADNRFIQATQNSILIPENAPVWVDAVAFEQLVPVDAFQDLSSPGRLAGLKTAVSLYRGDLLPELEDEWVAVDREHLWERWRYALKLLILHACETGDHSMAIRWATVIFQDEPSEELVAMLLMRLLILQGRRARAMQFYRQLAGELRREYGLLPPQEIQELVRTITSDSTILAPIELSVQEVCHYLQLARN